MRRIFKLSPVVLLVGMVAGAVHGTATPVSAQNCALNQACPGADGTVTSSLTVDHYDIVSVGPPEMRMPVEPNNGDTWTVTARYRRDRPVMSTPCDCTTLTYTASVDVTWTGSAWSASCTSGCNAGAGPIRSVSVCTVSSCTSGSTHSWEYELIVDLDNNLAALQCGIFGPNGAALYQVDYDTTVVDDGDTIALVDCTESGAVSPNSQTWSASDTGAFECTFTCAAASGPSISIVYD